MATTNRRSSRRAIQGQVRRKRVWARTLHSVVPPGTTLNAVDLLAQFRGANAFGAQPIGATVARIRVSGSALVSSASTGTVAVGIIKDSRNHSAPEVPNPLGEPDEDWMFHGLFPLKGSDQNALRTPVEWDVKAMRKIEEAGDTIWWSWDTGSLDTVAWRLYFSVLLLLP